MSSESFKLSDFITPEQVLWLNALVDKIHNCGNDHLTIDTTQFTNIDLYVIKNLIREKHCTSANRSLMFIEKFRGE